MLRHPHKGEQILKCLFPVVQQRFIQLQNSVLCNKNANVARQGKLIGKLFGQRVSGSKKRWFPAANSLVLFKNSSFGKVPSGGGKNSTRRMTVLNKLFMQHITDLLATGEISELILGKGLQISRVKISQDFAYVNVFWLLSGEADKDLMLENELQRCSGLLRHELSQLGLMGVVPRIKFVKDKFYSNLNQVETLLRDMDFSSQEEDEQLDIDSHTADLLKQGFYGNNINVMKGQEFLDKEAESSCNENVSPTEFVVPEMRHDVLGLDHKGIMIKILSKMRKSKQAWDQHLQNTPAEFENTTSLENSSTISSSTFNELTKINEKLAKVAANSDKFEAFLLKRKEKRNTPERKKFRRADHPLDATSARDEQDYFDRIMSTHQRQLFEDEDYLYDDLEDEHK